MTLQRQALSGHWIPEEQPDFVIDQLFNFFGNSNNGSKKMRTFFTSACIITISRNPFYLPQKSFLTYSFSSKATIPKKIKPTIKVVVGLRISTVISQIARWNKTTAKTQILQSLYLDLRRRNLFSFLSYSKRLT
jgi:hypothetical protein